MFLNIELPKLQRVLIIAILLRFMQSFMIYTEPFVVTGGGPGNATTFLSIDLVKIIQALIIMFIAADAIIRYVWRVPKPAEKAVGTFSKGWGS